MASRMKASLVLSLLCAAAVPTFAIPAKSIFNKKTADDPDIIPGKYIVQIKPGTSGEDVAAHQNAVRNLLLSRRDANYSHPNGTFTNYTEAVEKTFNIGSSFSAYTGTFEKATVEVLNGLDEVLSIEPDRYVRVEEPKPCTSKRLITQTGAIWSLGDLSHKNGSSTDYVYDESAGEGMAAYVFDTGIRLSHEEFEGRARFGINGLTGMTVMNLTNSDTNGHGTHVAATIVGKTYGVAKKAEVVDVKVFDGNTGSVSSILAGIEWAVTDVVVKAAQNTSVFSMSLTTTVSPMLDSAVVAAFEQGILTVAAAGNADAPAAGYSPAHVREAFTVGMTQQNRARAVLTEEFYGSNYGPELDVFAPGRDIISAGYGSDTAIANMSGTSMAAPLVSGLICYLRALEGPMSPEEVTARVLALALKDVVSDPKGSPNILAYNGSGK